MAKIKDIRKWGLAPGSSNESGSNPFLPILKRMLSSIGVGFKDPCCPEQKTCQDPCGYIQTLSTDDMSTVSITGLDGAPGNTIDLGALVDYSETVTSLVAPYFKPDADGRPNILVTGFMNEDHELQEVEVDLGNLLPDLMIKEGNYEPATNVVTLTTYDGTKITFTINELTGISNTLTKPNKQVIGTFHDEDEQNTDFYETVTSASLAGNILTIVNEDGSQAPIDFSDITPGCCIASAAYVDTTGVLTLTKVNGSTVTAVVSPKYTYALDAATDELVITSPDGSVAKVDLSGLSPDCCISTISDVDPATGNITFTRADGSTFAIKVDGLTTLTVSGSSLTYVDEKGVSNVIDLTNAIKLAETDTVVSGNISNGHSIGIYTNEAGTNFDIQETITSIANLSLNAGNNTLLLDYIKEDGTVQNLSLSLAALAIDAITSISVDTTTAGGPYLVITSDDGTTDMVKLSDVFETINHTLSSSGNTLTSVVGGTTQTAPIVNSIAAIITDNANLQISVNGVSSTSLDLTNAIKAAETNVAVADTNASASKKEIATVTNEDGVVTSIKETVTSFSATPDLTTGTLTLTFVDENGTSNTTAIDICALIKACVPDSTEHQVGYHPTDASVACADAP